MLKLHFDTLLLKLTISENVVLICMELQGFKNICVIGVGGMDGPVS